MSFLRANAAWLAALCATAGIAGVWGYTNGYQAGIAKFDKLAGDLRDAATKVETVQQVVMPTVHTERIEYRDRVQKIEVPKIIEREVYKNVCLDDDGVKAFNTLMGHK